MESELLAAVVSMVGTFGGTPTGIITSNKLTNHRLKELENKENIHNKTVERTFVLEEKTKVVNHRIDDLEEFQKHMERQEN